MDRIVTIGRRKTSIARIFVDRAKGSGKFIINGRPMEEFFPIDLLQIKVNQPFTVTEIAATDFDIKVNVNGGGFTGQAEAIRMGIARALVEMNEENKPALRHAGLMTRDPRMVERKKYGQPKARKKVQFSKR
jgi:small subunit ribosomal protein S9